MLLVYRRKVDICYNLQKCILDCWYRIDFTNGLGVER